MSRTVRIFVRLCAGVHGVLTVRHDFSPGNNGSPVVLKGSGWLKILIFSFLRCFSLFCSVSEDDGDFCASPLFFPVWDISSVVARECVFAEEKGNHICFSFHSFLFYGSFMLHFFLFVFFFLFPCPFSSVFSE